MKDVHKWKGVICVGRSLILYEYIRSLKYLIEQAESFSKKRISREELSKFYESRNFDYRNLNIYETENLISLSRILKEYGFSQTYESFENACVFLIADYENCNRVLDFAMKKLKKTAYWLYAGKPEKDFLCKSSDCDENSWELFVDALTRGDGEAVARRKFYLERINELASPKRLASIRSSKECDKIAFSLSPLQLELDFTASDGILPEVLSAHTNKSDLL